MVGLTCHNRSGGLLAGIRLARRAYMLVAALIVAALGSVAYPAEATDVTPDSANYLKASVVIASPGPKVQSCLGHVGIRMECPEHGLDYCFSFLMDDDSAGVARFFAGEVEGRIVAVTTPEYLRSFADEGRGVDQYALNLSHHEKQRLWMLLDQNIVDPEYRRFNFITNNCTSSVIKSLRDAMTEGDSVNYVWPVQARGVDNATGISYITRDNSWMRLLCMLLVGTEGEAEWDNSHRMSPELLVPLLEASTIVNDAQERPLLSGARESLVAPAGDVGGTWLTPTVVFAAVLALVLIISLGQWRLRWVKAPRVMDAALLTLQTAMSVALCYMTLHTGLFGKHWNWMLIPLNPLPLVAWLIWRCREWWWEVYLVYSIVLWAFVVVAGLWLSTMITPLLLLTAIFATRCTAKYLLGSLRRHPGQTENKITSTHN